MRADVLFLYFYLVAHLTPHPTPHTPHTPNLLSCCDQFLRRKWAREQGYRLRKYLWAFRDNRIAVCFEYEYHDDR